MVRDRPGGWQDLDDQIASHVDHEVVVSPNNSSKAWVRWACGRTEGGTCRLVPSLLVRKRVRLSEPCVLVVAVSRVCGVVQWGMSLRLRWLDAGLSGLDVSCEL